MSSSSPPFAPPAVPSPCRSQCKLDEDKVCIGCGRTIDDIRAWRDMPDAERLACVARAEARRLAASETASASDSVRAAVERL